ncbi:MAG: ribonuclease H-like domain-containing protein [Candidatus Omnitrophica bacterium]|nr:ribonuclease H-like domain-containing protein [Candidatus Omnitrophota bacterium]
MNEIVLDLETQNTFRDIGTRDPGQLKVSVVGIYDYAETSFQTFDETQLHELESRLLLCDRIIGFNIRRFDLPALSPYFTTSVDSLPVLDIMEEIQKVVGHRVSLNSVAEATLGKLKSGDGLDAIQYFRSGDIEKLKSYCIDDVRLTRDVYEFGRQNGMIYFTAKDTADKISVSVNWRRLDTLLEKTIRESFERKLVVEMEYRGHSAEAGNEKLQVHIYSIEGMLLKGLVPLEGHVRTFKMENIKRVNPLWSRYEIPPEYLTQSFI